MSEKESQSDSLVNDEQRAELFIRLLAENERRLTAYVMTFIPRIADAEDILQETKLALWRSFQQFETGTSFGAWARRAAFNRILDFRKRKGRESKRLIFSDACFEHLADTFETKAELRDANMDRLWNCVAKLQPNHRKIISLRYTEALSVEQVADRAKRSVGATYRVLSRIRLALRDCIQETQPSQQRFSEPTS